MELRHIYNIANLITNSNGEDTVTKDILDDMEVTVKVSPTTHYGIDKEFYRMTHNNSSEGFVHSDGIITAKIYGVKFNIVSNDF